jgi:hypothetical protein
MDHIADRVFNPSPNPPQQLNICAQLITREDELWMRGLCPLVKSMPLSVYSCNFTGGILSPCVGVVPACISYVTELDTFETLKSRICSVVKDPSSSIDLPLKLVVIKDGRFRVISDGTEKSEDEEADGTAAPWACFFSLYEKLGYDCNSNMYSLSSTAAEHELAELGVYVPALEHEGSR